MPYFPPNGGGSGGAVDSVNGKTGSVVLDATDVGATPFPGSNPSSPDVAKIAGRDTTGEVTELTVTPNATANTVMYRNASGQTNVTAPTANAHAATKKYVDDSIIAAKPARTTLTSTGSTGDVTLNAGAESFHLVNATSDAALRVRGYRTTADRTADQDRAAGTLPAVKGVVLFEFVFDAAGTYWTTGFKSFLTSGSNSLYLRIEGTATLDLVIER